MVVFGESGRIKEGLLIDWLVFNVNISSISPIERPFKRGTTDSLIDWCLTAILAVFQLYHSLRDYRIKYTSLYK